MRKKIILISIISVLIIVSIVASYYFIRIKKNAEIKYLKVIKENKPIILYFYDKRSIGCKLATPIVKRAKDKYGDKINFILVNINNRDNFGLVELYEIENVPAYIVVNAKKELLVDAIRGGIYFDEGFFKLFYDRFSKDPNWHVGKGFDLEIYRYSERIKPSKPYKPLKP